MQVSRVAILGTGLIGASIGLALRALEPSWSIVGYDRSRHALGQAADRGAMTAPAASVAEAVSGAELVILAAPVAGIRGLLVAISPLLQPGVLVTDVGSTKRHVMEWAAELILPDHSFIGGHPMAGKVAVGPEEADRDLFSGATWCLTPRTGTPEAAVEWLSGLIRRLGARPRLVDPLEHDDAAAAVSHLPYLLAVASMSYAAQQPNWELGREIAATGFGHATRLSGKDPEMYVDIMRTNRESVVRQLDGLIQELTYLRSAVAGEESALSEYFEQARRANLDWLEHHAPPSAHEPE